MRPWVGISGAIYVAALMGAGEARAGSAQFSCDAATESQCHYVLFAPDGAIKKFALAGGESGWARDVEPGYRFCFGRGEEPDPASCEWRKLRAIEPDVAEAQGTTTTASRTATGESVQTTQSDRDLAKSVKQADPEAFRLQAGRKRVPGVTVETITLEDTGTGFRKRSTE